MGGILESVAGAFGDEIETAPQVGTGSTSDLFALAFNNPQLMQIFAMAFQLGKNPSDFIKPYIKEVTGNDQIGANNDPTLLKMGTQKQGATFLDMGKLAAAIPGLKQQVEDKSLKDFQNTYEKLAGVPALQQIFKEAGGGDSIFQGKVDKAFGQLGEFALGKQAQGGLLHNQLVREKALAPFALQKAQFELGNQKNALAQALGLAGAPGLPGQSAGAGGSTGFMQFQPSVFNAANLGFNASAANQQGFMWQAGLQQQQYEKADASLTQNLSGIGGGLGKK